MTNDSRIDEDLLALARRAVATLDPALAEILAQRLRRARPDPPRVAAAREMVRLAYRDAIDLRATKLLQFVRKQKPIYEHLVSALDRQVIEMFRVDREGVLDATRWARSSDRELREYLEIAGSLWARDKLGELNSCTADLERSVSVWLSTPFDYLSFLVARADVERCLLKIAGAPTLLDTLEPTEIARVEAFRQGLIRAAQEDLWRLSAP